MVADLVGIWKLVDTGATSGGNPIPFPRQSGRLWYDDKGNVVVSHGSVDRPRLSGVDMMSSSVDEKVAMAESWNTYFGTYTINEADAVVTHHVESSLFPNWGGTDLERQYSLDGDRLTLTTPPTALLGQTLEVWLIWERM